MVPKSLEGSITGAIIRGYLAFKKSKQGGFFF
jgi:hypothetical protein